MISTDTRENDTLRDILHDLVFSGDFTMSGHSKWSTIKHKKAKEDAKRGKVFTKLIKEITIAARIGGGDPNANPRLRTLVDKAKEVNMPIDNTTRAIKRGTGELPGVSYEEITYEGYGPNGIAIMMDTLTDNKNRTVAELRHIFSAKGGNLAETGSVAWMFGKKGVINVSGSNLSEDKLLELLIDFDVDNIWQNNDIFSIVCDMKAMEMIKSTLTQAGLKVENAEIEWVPSTTIDVSDSAAQKAVELLESLQDHDDVKNVFTNMA